MATRRRAAAAAVEFYYFVGEPVVRLTEKLNTTPNPGVKVFFKNGKVSWEVIDSVTKIGHDPINDSHVCPGSPGCP